jgi:hypothetical protein
MKRREDFGPLTYQTKHGKELYGIRLWIGCQEFKRKGFPTKTAARAFGIRFGASGMKGFSFLPSIRGGARANGKLSSPGIVLHQPSSGPLC